jgi:hypothetical protein
MDTRGELIAEIDVRSIRWFSYYEVRALKLRRLRQKQDERAEIRIAAFELFRKRVAWRDIATRRHHDAVRVRQLRQLYSKDDDHTAGAGQSNGASRTGR